MLRLSASTPGDTLWDARLPTPLQHLPEDLAGIDRRLHDPELLSPFRTRWAELRAGAPPAHGRPTMPMATYMRVMVLKHRYGWGYPTLMEEINDSFHLRRFCLLSLLDTVPHESTVRKLTRRLGPQLSDELIRGLFTKALRERRFRPRALRADSTVEEADIRYPTDAGLCADGVKSLARSARKLGALLPALTTKVRDRSRAVGKRLRALGRSLRRRTGEATSAGQRFTQAAAAPPQRSVREARRLIEAARPVVSRTRGPRKPARQRATQHLQQILARAERVVEQIRQRCAGEKITDRLVSFADPDARPVRRGKLAKPNEFGSVVQLAEVTEHTRRGARGLLWPPKLRAGSTNENTLLPETGAELTHLDISLREGAFDAGFVPAATQDALAEVGATVFITGTPPPGSHRTQRRLARYRVGSEGRIAHLKREYGAGRSRLRGTTGAQVWEGWAILAYNLDTLVPKEQQPTATRKQ